MFYENLNKPYMRNMDCVCTLGLTCGREKQESRCFLMRPKTQRNQQSFHMNCSLEGLKMKGKNDRKYSLRTRQKENENSMNLSMSNNTFHHQKSKSFTAGSGMESTMNVSFSYRASPKPVKTKLSHPVASEVLYTFAKLGANMEKVKKTETQNSTITSLNQNVGPSNVWIGPKININYRNRELIAQSAATLEALSDFEEIKINERFYSTISLNKQKKSPQNCNYLSTQVNQGKEDNENYRTLTRGASKGNCNLSQLCFKHTESVDEEESDRISYLVSSVSSLTQENAFDGTWNFTLKDLTQQRLNKGSPQLT